MLERFIQSLAGIFQFILSLLPAEIDHMCLVGFRLGQRLFHLFERLLLFKQLLQTFALLLVQVQFLLQIGVFGHFGQLKQRVHLVFFRLELGLQLFNLFLQGH